MPDASAVARIGAFLKQRGSPDEWVAAAGLIVAEAFRQNLDPRLIVAVMGAESQFATRYNRSSHNPFGIVDANGAVHVFPSKEAAIHEVAGVLHRHVYVYGQRTVADLYSGKGNVTYGGPHQNWFYSQHSAYCQGICGPGKTNVTQFMQMQGANPAQLTYPAGW